MLGRLIAAVSVGAAALIPSLAHAGEALPRLDWKGLFARPEWGILHKQPSVVGSVDALRSRVTDGSAREPKAWLGGWLGSAFRFAIVARDWQGAQRVVGTHLCATDALRVSRSSRMVLSRIVLMDGRIAPFAHLGLGQWRVDSDLLPFVPIDTQLAGQVGFGLDVPLASHAGLAVETDYTVLYREALDQHLLSPRVWSTLAVARMEL